MRSPWIIAFGVVTVLHLALLGAELTPWDSITKCLLAPLLIGWVLQLNGPRLWVAGLVGCFFGDLFLDLPEAWFAAGMGAFAVAHVCFIVFFARRGALPRLRRAPWVPALLLAAGACLVVWCWDGLPDDIRPLVPIYAVLLSGTAMTALVVDRRAGIGAVCFLVSDGIIAASQAERVDPDALWVRLAIMVLYIAAIFLMTAGVLDKERRTLALQDTDGFDPTRRTDCWPQLPGTAARRPGADDRP